MSARTPVHPVDRPWWKMLAFAAGGLATALFAGALVIGHVFGTSAFSFASAFVFSPLLMAWVGAVILVTRPGNRVGLLILLGGIAGVGQSFFNEWALLALSRPGLPGEALAAWLSSWLWFPTVVTMSVLLLIFPTGRPLPRWRWVMWFAVALAVVGMTAGTIPMWGLPTEVLTDPFSDAPEYFLLVFVVAPLTALVLIPLALISMVVRYRRAGPLERSQIKWLAWAMGVILFVLIVAPPVPGLFGLSLSLVPASIAVAILRHRLFDIDVVINRTLVYGSITASLVAIYFGSVVVLQTTFRTLIGEGSQLVVVASTLAIAALFNPLRRRIQALVDRRFYRKKYDAANTLEVFSAKLRKDTDLERLESDLVSVVWETMQPAHASLWLRAGAEAPREDVGEGIPR